MTPFTKQRRLRLRSRNDINILRAGVLGALVPYLNVFPFTQQDRCQSEVGLVTTIGGPLGLWVQSKHPPEIGL